MPLQVSRASGDLCGQSSGTVRRPATTTQGASIGEGRLHTMEMSRSFCSYGAVPEIARFAHDFERLWRQERVVVNSHRGRQIGRSRENVRGAVQLPSTAAEAQKSADENHWFTGSNAAGDERRRTLHAE